MFAAAVLDAFPERAAPLAAALAESRLHEIVAVRTEPFTDGVLRGLRFHAAPASAPAERDGGARAQGDHPHPHPHHHPPLPPGHRDGDDHHHDRPDVIREAGHSLPAADEARASRAAPAARGGEPGVRAGSDPHGHHHPPRGADRESRAVEGARTLHADPGGRSDHHSGGRREGGGHDHPHPHDHPHRRFADVRAWLGASRLPRPVAERAAAIFTLLAEAEAEVHGIAVADVTFHEVGAWDSIADVVCAAWLIDSLKPVSWSSAPLPLGGGRVATAHGALPVPAPATALLLTGMPVHHDGVGGERVTPTGAAILRHLDPAFEAAGLAGRIARTGHGFGSRRLEGMSNVLRALVLDVDGGAGGVRSSWEEESVGVCSFEVDDQTAEDLAVGLERLRAGDGVLDVVQTPVFGKKGRMAASVRVLARPAARERVIERCFAETATLGVRWQTVRRAALAREEGAAEVAGERIRLKRAERPGGGATVKAEMDDVARAGGGGSRAEREAARRRAEAEAE